MLREASALVAVVGGAEAAVGVAAGLRGHAVGRRSAGIVALTAEGWSARRGVPTEALADVEAWRALGSGPAVGVAEVGVGDGWTDPPLRPAIGRTALGVVAVACSGGLVQREDSVLGLLRAGSLLAQATDEEAILALVARSSQRTLVNRVVDALGALRGGWATVVLSTDLMVAGRDPLGLRRLVVGDVPGGVVVASDEQQAGLCGAVGLRELEPGELLVVQDGQVTSVWPFARRTARPCGQQALALSSAGARVGGRQAMGVQLSVGAALCQAHGVSEADVVLPADAASQLIAAGFAGALGRTVLPVAASGLGPGPVDALLGKVAVLVGHGGADDPAGLCDRVLAAGAREVHLRLATAPVRHRCPFGVEVAGTGGDGVAQAASLGWLDRASLERLIGPQPCLGCVDGELPVAPTADLQMALFPATG